MKRTKSKFKHGQMLNVIVIVIAALVLSAMPISMMVSANENAVGEIVILTRTANLISPTGSINPHGNATYEVYQSGNRELEIEAEDVNLADGTVLRFFVDNNLVGQVSLISQRAKLRLKTEDGQNVPSVNDGSTVEVKNGNTTLVAGVFGGGNSTPTPSPSVSPTGSPSPSPSISPSPSPSVSPTGSPSPSPSVSPSPSPSVSPSPSPSPTGNNLFAALTGATVNGVLPNGYAEYEVESSRRKLDIRVRQINLPTGTSLNISVDNVSVGQLILDGNEGRLRLRSDNGQTVPVIVNGSTIQVNNGGTTILSGVFSGGGQGTPTPSGQGRFFEATLNGSQVTPPVSTNGRGEVKVLLNQNETQATITGEFHDLSSAQTTAKIESLVGTTSMVYDFGTIGGRNGNFATATIAVTAIQVQQLRTGLWSAVIGTQNYPNGEIRGQLQNDSNVNDFDGDGSDDFAVFRPSTGTWYTQNSEGFGGRSFGLANDKVVSGDYDGDGKTDVAVFRNQNGSGIWYVNRSSDNGLTAFQFGLGDDKPVRGDFDGDGRTDFAVFRPSNGTWYIQKSDNTGFIFTQFGLSNDIPIATDLDGDGKDDIVVFRPSNGVWYWLRSSDGGFSTVQFGLAGDVPIRGDFDGDGKADISVFRPSNGVWYLLRSSDNGFQATQFGLSDDIPVAGNFDGDNKTDIAVFRPSNGVWYILRSVNGTFDFRQFGLNGDVPAPSR